MGVDKHVRENEMSGSKRVNGPDVSALGSTQW